MNGDDDRPREPELGRYYSEGPVFRSLSEITGTPLRDEKVHELTEARVLYVNHELILRDFPELAADISTARDRSREHLQAPVDRWLLSNVAFISTSQASQCEANTPIPSRPSEVIATRPHAYGRALLFSIAANRRPGTAPNDLRMAAEGLLDVKGSGCAPDVTPRIGTHRDGLLKLSDALLEVLNQQLIEAIFRHAGTGFSTVPIYAVIDPGFDIKLPRDRTAPAGLLVRRAHRRPKGGAALPKYGTPEQIVQLEVELLLRRYGITSSNQITSILFREENGELRVRWGRTELEWLKPKDLATLRKASRFDGTPLLIDGVNVQLTQTVSVDPLRCELIDFGTYRVFASFDRPLLSLVTDRLLRWGGAIRPGEPRFVVPDPAVRIPCETWGPVVDGDGETHLDIFCAELASALEARSMGRDELHAALDAMLREATRGWHGTGGAPVSDISRSEQQQQHRTVR